MNPLLQAALMAILRAVLQVGAGYLVTWGVWEQGEADKYVMGAALFLLTIGWSLWTQYANRLKLVAALASPIPQTEAAIERQVATGNAPSAQTPKDQVPVPAKS